MGYIYLASPYTHEDFDVRERRYKLAVSATNHLMNKGLVVYSPISHSHHIDLFHPDDSRGHEFWMKQCITMLDSAESLMVLKLKGWDTSKGVAMEIAHAQKIGIPIEFMSYYA